MIFDPFKFVFLKHIFKIVNVFQNLSSPHENFRKATETIERGIKVTKHKPKMRAKLLVWFVRKISILCLESSRLKYVL